MSAYVVSDRHINELVSWAAQNMGGIWAGDEAGFKHFRGTCSAKEPYGSPPDAEQSIAEVLKAENVRSICARYSDEKPENYEPIRFEAVASQRTPVEILKACECYDYQACETDDYLVTPAAAIIRQIRSAAIAELLGYKDADWEFCD